MKAGTDDRTPTFPSFRNAKCCFTADKLKAVQKPRQDFVKRVIWSPYIRVRHISFQFIKLFFRISAQKSFVNSWHFSHGFLAFFQLPDHIFCFLLYLLISRRFIAKCQGRKIMSGSMSSQAALERPILSLALPLSYPGQPLPESYRASDHRPWKEESGSSHPVPESDGCLLPKQPPMIEVSHFRLCVLLFFFQFFLHIYLCLNLERQIVQNARLCPSPCCPYFLLLPSSHTTGCMSVSPSSVYTIKEGGKRILYPLPLPN